MNQLLYISTLFRFFNNIVMLNWAKENLDNDTFKIIQKSYKDIKKYTVIIMVLLMLTYSVVLLPQISIIDKYSADLTRQGHVSGKKVWYIKNDKKELNLSDYGYNYNDYKENDKFVVYLDKNYNVKDIAPLEEVQNEKNKPFIIMIGGIVLIIFIILFIYVPIAYNTFGKAWGQFNRWYEKANLKEDKFILKQ